MIQLLKKNKFFRNFLLANNLVMLGACMYNMVFVVYVANVYQSKTLIGIANSIVYIPMLFGMVLGFMADKTRDKGKWFLRLNFIQVFLFSLVAFLIQHSGYAIFALVCLLNIVSDLMSDFIRLLVMPIFKKQVAEEDLDNAYGLRASLMAVVNIAGNTLGLGLLELTKNNYSLVALVNALTFGLAFLIYWLIRDKLTHDVEITDENLKLKDKFVDLYQTSSAVFKQAGNLAFFPMVLSVILSNSVGIGLSVAMSIFLFDVPLFGLSYGQSIYIFGLLQILGNILGGMSTKGVLNRLSLSQLLLVGFGLNALIALNGLTLKSSFFSIMIMGISCITSGRFNPKFDALMMKHIPEDKLGQVNSFLVFCSTMTLPFVSAFFAALSVYSLGLTWGIALVLSLVSCFVIVKYRLD